MSASQASPQSLLVQLVHTALARAAGSSHPVHLGESAEDVVALRRKLQSKLFGALIASLPGPLQRSSNSPRRPPSAGAGAGAGGRGLRPKERLLMIVFKLRECRKFDEAHCLESMLERLAKMKEEEDQNADFMDRVVEFLLALAGSKQTSHQYTIGHQRPLLPAIGHRATEETVVLPKCDWFHGDGRHVHRCDEHRPYIHYDRELFECRHLHFPGDDSGISEVSCNESHLNFKIFETQPGRDLRGNRLFAVKSIMGNAFEKRTRESLFGGLVHSHVTRLDAQLSIPALPDSSNPAFLGIKIPSLAESPLSDDEGYHESMSGSVTSALSTPEKENLWDGALHYKPSRHRTWENIGNHPRPTERPYLTEAGPSALDLVYELRCKEAAIVRPPGRPPPMVLRDQRRLLQHAWNVLIGLPSELFILERETLTFSVNPGICLTGTTPESLRQPLAEFAAAGTDYNRLWHASRQPVVDSTYTGGLVLQAFLGAVRRYLQYYNAQVLLARSRLVDGCHGSGGGGGAATREPTLLLVRSVFGRLIAQLRYLSSLCGCRDRRGTKPGAPGDPLPMGIELLSYLYQEALDCTGTDNYRLLLSLLRSSCAPYLMFIQDWVFHGICRDAYGEFMIQAHHTYLFHRDKHYWTHGYVLMTGEKESAVPLFLHELSSAIYICGKSINLLKQCAPEHFVCNVTVDTPCIGLTFSTAELDVVTTRTRTYVKHMEVLAGQLTVSRREKERREEAAKAELLAVARRTAAEEQEKYNELLKERRDALGAKKRKEFQALKEQMQKDLLRRGQEVEDEKEADRERMEQVKRREQAAQDVESELEQQAREEVIKLYAELSKQATLREQRALWRVRRRQLDQKRIEFLQREKEALKQELDAPRVKFSTRVPTDESQLGGTSQPDVAGKSPREDVGTGGSASKEGESVGVTSDDIVAGETAKVDGEETMPTLHKQASEQRDRIVYRPVERTPATSDVADIATLRSGENTKGDVVYDDDQQNDRVEVGDVENEEVEPVLALIRGSETDSVSQSRLISGSKKGKTKKGISVEEFLPRDEPSQADTELLDSDEEQAKDTTVEDVLLEIGSSLPEQDVAVPGREATHAAPRAGNIMDDILGAEKGHDSNGSGDGIVGLPHRLHTHGHPSESSLQKTDTASSDIDDGGSQRRHDHGHVSDSSLKVGGGSGETGDSLPLHGVPQRQHQHGHVTDSSLQTLGSISRGETEESIRLTGVPHVSHQHGHVSASTLGGDQEAVGPQSADYGGTVGLPQRAHVHGHPSQTTMSSGDDPEHGEDISHVRNVHGHASDSSLGAREEGAAGAAVDRPVGLPHRAHIHGHASDSTMGDVIAGAHQEHEPSVDQRKETGSTDPTTDSGYDSSQVKASLSPATASSSSHSIGMPGLPHRPALAPQRPAIEASVSADALPGVPHRSSAHGHASDSSLGDVMYPSQMSAGVGGHPDPVTKEDQRAVVSLSKHGHPSDSSVQRLMYPVREQEEQREEIMETAELPVTVWADEGREVTEFDFTMFEGLPDTDLLGRTGFEPLRSEIGDYGVHASQSESIEATNLLPLPIIIKRSITAPLRAQVWLVNQSILDYFLVDLRIDRHFTALRRFLFLQDGEFGQALCDQIFDKLAHCVHVQELLSPLTLNQILSRAIQLSASSNSEHADNLSFALKWHPSVFKPNAIDTLDCLELRYLVEWPNNIVITDTCLSKYNKVFSFLLQLKRTGWVLRDIHHQLKISAMLHKASSSPQYHQLQLFRHEMQHFVNVMQGYVVNQVIHVSWEEFQKDLRENVQNLDDLREKHGLYLNKAILRCLLNKKAAPVMKIICDILSLVLKVRTQLTTSAWAWDATSGQVIHPCFRNIKKSYMVFKEFSGFLYKVVAKLVTRGYQPHLEEFMLRLNFNDYYQEHKS